MAQRRKIILCVDDNMEVLKSLRLQLRSGLRHHARIILAAGPEEALKALEVLKPEHSDAVLIVSDWLMPNMRGEELIRNIETRWGPLQTIVLSGHITEKAALELSELKQVLAIMAKPWDGEELLQLIAGQLDISKLPQPLTPER